jgi:predicted Zn-dependent protease
VKDFSPQKKIEFLPVYELRDIYPPLPLPESSFTVVEPETTIIERQFASSVETVTDSIYRNGLKALNERLASSEGRRALKVRNQIGVLHARFGRDAEADQMLRACISEDPGFLPSYVNLANVLLSKGKLDSAQRIVQNGLDRRSDSVLLNLLMARIALKKGNNTSALRYFRMVKAKSSHLAERYAELFEGLEGGGRERAGVDDDEFGLIWDSGE